MSSFGETTGPGTVRFERLLPGSIELVWAYLTDPSKRATWLAGGPMELRVGGAVELEFHNSKLSTGDDPPPERFADHADGHRMSGRITRCEPPRLLAYTWGEPSNPDSEVTFELTAQGGQTVLVLTHRRLGERPNLISVAGGWHTHLDILAARVHGLDPGPFWAAYLRNEGEYETRL